MNTNTRLEVAKDRNPLCRVCSVRPVDADVSTPLVEFFDNATGQIQFSLLSLNVVDERLIRGAVRATNRPQETRIENESHRER
jgi:hypothetical protein